MRFYRSTDTLIIGGDIKHLKALDFISGLDHHSPQLFDSLYDIAVELQKTDRSSENPPFPIPGLQKWPRTPKDAPVVPYGLFPDEARRSHNSSRNRWGRGSRWTSSTAPEDQPEPQQTKSQIRDAKRKRLRDRTTGTKSEQDAEIERYGQWLDRKKKKKRKAEADAEE